MITYCSSAQTDHKPRLSWQKLWKCHWHWRNVFCCKDKKIKKKLPFCPLHPCGIRNCGNLTRPHYLAWEEFIFSTKIKMSVQENSMIKIDFTLFCGNYSLVAFADKSTAKGQLISKCIFGAIVWTKKATKFFSRISALASKKMSNQKNKDTLLH